MKLLPILTAAVIPMLLTSCYTDGYGYVETGSYYPGYYGRGYYPGYYAGHYGHIYSRPRYYASHHRHYGRNWRHDGDWRRRHHHGSSGSWRNTNISIGGWTPGRDRDRRWR